MFKRLPYNQKTEFHREGRRMPALQVAANQTSSIPFRIHPRVFAALGADLVTNDVVAVIELVKNSYDALATRVDVLYGVADGQPFLEISDDGVGMSRHTLETAWSVVATPYRSTHPIETRGKLTRRTSGEKGLGRLSAARLGKRLAMTTKAENDSCWLVEVDWSGLAEKNALEACEATCTLLPPKQCPIKFSGTRLRITGLESPWSDDQFEDLRENLSRLLAPFGKAEDFEIHLSIEGSGDLGTRVSAPAFLDKPPYAIRGHVDAKGNVKGRYEYHPITQTKSRTAQMALSWEDVKESSEGALRGRKAPSCGPFEFEIRAWDISSSDTDDLSERFQIAKASVRKSIRAHKGISVYRDGILVLPKSEDARDWLGLDLRRISRIGTRLSTSQIVGYVAISADRNPRLEDSSNRESLTQNAAVRDFQGILKAIVANLEVERDRDRLRPSDDIKLSSLIDGVTADDLVEEVSALAEEGMASKEVVQRVAALNGRLHLVQNAIKLRFVYYSRLATVGSIAQMLVHEIRNRTTSIGRFLRTCRRPLNQQIEAAFTSQLELAESSVAALERLADTFAPLANRSYRRGKRNSELAASVERCFALLERDVEKVAIIKRVKMTAGLMVAMDPGELDTVLLNLLSNAIYWLAKTHADRLLEVLAKRNPTTGRIEIRVDDSGPGVEASDAESIFMPGITKRPNGIGMGLTIAAEIVSEHNGHLALIQPGRLNGASFTFDVPGT
jgi:signal transduction histidine kinase